MTTDTVTTAPATPPTPTQRPRLAIWGVLVQDARHYTSADGTPHLHVLISQPLPGRRQSLPIQATYHYPDCGTPNISAQLASGAAACLRKGAEVMVTGEGVLYADQHDGHAVLTVSHTRSIRPMGQRARREAA